MSGVVYFPSKLSPKKYLYSDENKRKYFDAQETELDAILTQGPVIIKEDSKENVPLFVQLPNINLDDKDIDLNLTFPQIDEEISLHDNKGILHVLFAHFNKNPLSQTCYIIANLTACN